MDLNIKARLKKLYKSSWFITLFATTLGVLLAFYLNNLDERSKIENRKEISIQNLVKELANNKAELINSGGNDSLINFLSTIKDIDPRIPNELKLSVADMARLKQRYTYFIIVNDSVNIDTDRYEYDVNFRLNITLDELQNIAWETTKMSDITNQLDHDCLQGLVKIYSLQEVYINEQQKVLNYFVNAEHVKLLNALRVVQQFKSGLLDAMVGGQEKVKNCG